MMLGDLIVKTDCTRGRLYYREALEEYTALAAETRSPRDREGIAITLCALAESGRDDTERNAQWRQAFEILEELEKETGARTYHAKKMICEINLKGVGNVELPGAAKEPDNDELLRMFEEEEKKARESAAAGNDAEEAEHWRKSGLILKQLRQRISFEETSKDAQNYLGNTMQAARAFLRCGRTEEAGECLEVIAAEGRKLEVRYNSFFMHTDPIKRMFSSICAEAYMRLAQMSDDPDRIETLCDEALQELHRICSLVSQAEFLLDLARGYWLAGKLPLPDYAEIYQDEARRFCEKGLKTYPEEPGFALLKQEMGGKHDGTA